MFSIACNRIYFANVHNRVFEMASHPSPLQNRHIVTIVDSCIHTPDPINTPSKLLRAIQIALVLLEFANSNTVLLES
jgi:hypothetical protein